MALSIGPLPVNFCTRVIKVNSYISALQQLAANGHNKAIGTRFLSCCNITTTGHMSSAPPHTPSAAAPPGCLRSNTICKRGWRRTSSLPPDVGRGEAPRLREPLAGWQRPHGSQLPPPCTRSPVSWSRAGRALQLRNVSAAHANKADEVPEWWHVYTRCGHCHATHSCAASIAAISLPLSPTRRSIRSL
jgi:hypothetical protein